MKHAFTLDGELYEIGLARTAAGYALHRDGRVIACRLEPAGDAWQLYLGHDGQPVELACDGDTVWIHLAGSTHALHHEHPLVRLAQLAEGAGGDQLRASMPGSLVALEVEPGQAVKQGQTVLVMESMKMETTLVAPHDAVIAEVHVAVGQTFDKDALLVSFAVAGDADA